MKLIKSFILSGLILSVIFIAGCNEETSISNEPFNNQQVPKFSLPAGATLVSAELLLYVEDGNGQNVNIYRNLGDWDEATVNTVNRPPYDPTVEGSYNVTDGDFFWLTVGITGLVQKWFNCEPNYGLLLNQLEETPEFDVAWYSSKDNVNGNGPKLVIEYSIGGGTQVDTLEAIADAYIWPGVASGNGPNLFTGYTNGLEKESLIKFDIECAPPQEECETAFAYDDAPEGTCFLDLGFNRWGWSIYLAAPGTYTFPVYAAAGQCDLTKGTYVGDVTAVYANGTVSFTYDFEPGFSTEETHFYAGYNPVAKDKKGKATVAPGQYKIGTGLSGGIYIIAHAVVCSSDWD